VLETAEELDGALHLVRSDFPNNEPKRNYWRVPIKDGEGAYIATYTGEDVRPTPPFSTDPIQVAIHFGSAEKAAHEVYSYLAPKGDEPDYRVGVVAVYKKKNAEPSVAILNKIKP